MENHSINKKVRYIKNYSIDTDTYDDFSSLLKTSLDYQKEFRKIKKIEILNIMKIN